MLFSLIFLKSTLKNSYYADVLRLRITLQFYTNIKQNMNILHLFNNNILRHATITGNIFPPPQEEQYPDWSPGLRAFWRRGRNRVYAFWFISFSMSIVVATAITTDYLNWDEIGRDFMPTNEVSRAYLASFILVMDLLIVMQVLFTLSYMELVLMWKTLPYTSVFKGVPLLNLSNENEMNL